MRPRDEGRQLVAEKRRLTWMGKDLGILGK